jgi:homoserine/homoserine lactone efflux protein
MSFQLWLTYAALELWLSATPGPAVMTVIGQGVRHGWRKACFGAAGICAANLIFFALSAAGIGAFIAASPGIYAVLRWGGIGYLTWSAVILLAARERVEARVGTAGDAPRALFVQAVATQLGNPKAIIFFASILAPFLEPAAPWPLPVQLGVFALTTTLTEFPVLVLYGVAGARGSRLLPHGRVGLWQDRIAGSSLLIVAAWLALR